MKSIDITKRMLFTMMVGTAMTFPTMAQEANVLKIGSIFALSGANASIGREALGGTEYAIMKINEAGGVAIGGETYTLQLINVDDESRAERSVAAAERLINEDDVPVILTPPSSTTTLAVIPLAERAERIALSFVAAAPSVISPDFQYSFRSTLTSIMNVSPSIEYLIQERGAKKIAYLGRNDDWGRAAGEAIRNTAAEFGSEVVVEEYFDTGATDFYGLLTNVRASEPDAVVGAAFMEDGVSMIRQYRELQMDPPFLSVAVIWASPTFVEAAGSALDGVYIATGPTTATSDELEAFKAEFQDETGGPALPFGITAYDNVNLLVAAMQEAGTIDPKVVAQTLRNFEFEGLLQTYKFDDSTQSEVVINVNQIDDGQVSVISSLTTK